MGSLAWAGVIGGAGEGLQRHVEGRRETRMQDDEQAHQVQLQNMRDKAAELRAMNREEFEVDQATVRSEHEIGLATTRSTFESGESKAQRLFEGEESLEQRKHEAFQGSRERESREFIAMVQKLGPIGGAGGGLGTRGKAGDWDVTIQPGTNLETGDPQPSMIATHPSGTALELVGDRLVHVADPDLRAEGLRKWENPKVQEAEEAKLYNDLIRGEDTGQEFLRTYKYLPHSYMTEKFKQDAEGIGGQLWNYFLGRRAGRQGLPGEYEGTRLPRSTGDVEAGVEAERAGPGGETGGLIEQGRLGTAPGRRGDSMLLPGEGYIPPPEPDPEAEAAATEGIAPGGMDDETAAEIARIVAERARQLEQGRGTTETLATPRHPLSAFQEVGNILAVPFRPRKIPAHPAVPPEQQ
jgi:hypothetical protein